MLISDSFTRNDAEGPRSSTSEVCFNKIADVESDQVGGDDWSW